MVRKGQVEPLGVQGRTDRREVLVQQEGREVPAPAEAPAQLVLPRAQAQQAPEDREAEPGQQDQPALPVPKALLEQEEILEAQEALAKPVRLEEVVQPVVVGQLDNLAPRERQEPKDQPELMAPMDQMEYAARMQMGKVTEQTADTRTGFLTDTISHAHDLRFRINRSMDRRSWETQSIRSFCTSAQIIRFGSRWRDRASGFKMESKPKTIHPRHASTGIAGKGWN